MKYVKERVLKYFKISMKFLNISKWNISSCIPSARWPTRLDSIYSFTYLQSPMQLYRHAETSLLLQGFLDVASAKDITWSNK